MGSMVASKSCSEQAGAESRNQHLKYFVGLEMLNHIEAIPLKAVGNYHNIEPHNPNHGVSRPAGTDRKVPCDWYAKRSQTIVCLQQKLPVNSQGYLSYWLLKAINLILGKLLNSAKHKSFLLEICGLGSLPCTEDNCLLLAFSLISCLSPIGLMEPMCGSVEINFNFSVRAELLKAVVIIIMQFTLDWDQRA